MQKKHNAKIIILGSGHLAARLKRKLQKKDVSVSHLASEHLKEIDRNTDVSKFQSMKALLERHDIENTCAICILDDKDSRNIELALIAVSISKKIPVFVSLFNESLGEHLKGLHKNLHVINPAALSAPFFANRFLSDKKNGKHRESITFSAVANKEKPIIFVDKLLFGCLAGFIAFFMFSIIFFHISENISWIDALYFSSTTVATVGYGDISLRNSTFATKLFGVFFMLSSMIFTWVFFSLLVERIVKKRYDIALGRRKYHLKNHIIICGLGRMGSRLVDELALRGEDIIIIEANPDNRFFDMVKARGARVFVGDASLSKSLLDVGIQQAAGIFVMIDDDMKNLEIGLNAMSLNSKVPIILRMYDEELAQKVRSQLKIPFAHSTTSVAADHIFKELQQYM